MPRSMAFLLLQIVVTQLSKVYFNLCKAVTDAFGAASLLGTFRTSGTKFKCFSSTPGPLSLPIVGVLPHFLPFIGSFSFRMSALQFSESLARFGDVVRFSSSLGKKPTVFILTPELALEVYQQTNMMPRRDLLDSVTYFRRNVRSEDFQGNFGVLSSDGAEWRSIRRAVDPFILSQRLIDKHRKPVNEITSEAIIGIEMALDSMENSIFSEYLHKAIKGWAFESLSMIIFGRRMGALSEGTAEQTRCENFLKCLHRVVESIFRLEFGLALWKCLPTPAFKRGMKDYDMHCSYVKEFLDETKSCPVKNGLVEKLRESAPEMVHGITNDVMLAGVDTVGLTLVSMLYVFACNPEEQSILRQKLKEDPEDMKYLRACIKEAFRILPTTGGNYRTTSKDLYVGGYHIPKDVDIVLCHQFMSAQEAEFPRAREFLPERWLATEEDPLYAATAHPYAFLPFGSGGRGCVGRNIAQLEIECFIQQLLTRFVVRWDAPAPTFINPAVNFIRQPYQFVFEKV